MCTNFLIHRCKLILCILGKIMMLVFYPQQIVTKENREEEVYMILVKKGLLCLGTYKQNIQKRCNLNPPHLPFPTAGLVFLHWAINMVMLNYLVEHYSAIPPQLPLYFSIPVSQ